MSHAPTAILADVVSYNLIPLELPPLDVDENLLGNLKYVGYTFFGIIAFAVLLSVCWTVYHRKSIVVRAAQPFFLVMVAVGVLLMSSALVPLSFDDGGDPENNSETFNVGVCMSIPWLAFTGFTVTFSALFSKTWRVNRLFRTKNGHARLQVNEKDVLAPFVVLLTCNIAVLLCWTLLDPLTYVRREYDGTDFWNRVIASYGSCRSDNAAAYLVPLGLLNFCVLLTACSEAYEARNIEVEFSESKYIGLTIFSLCQGFMTGIPIVTVVRETPEAFYLVLALAVFVICMVVLLLIFLPKYQMRKEYGRMSEVQQKELMAKSVLKSTLPCTSVVLHNNSSGIGVNSNLGHGSWKMSSLQTNSNQKLSSDGMSGPLDEISEPLREEWNGISDLTAPEPSSTVDSSALQGDQPAAAAGEDVPPSEYTPSQSEKSGPQRASETKTTQPNPDSISLGETTLHANTSSTPTGK